MTLDGSGAHEQSLKEKGFGVFASHTGVHPYVSTSTAINLMHNRHVTYDDGIGAWSYSPLAYWPNGEDGADQLVTFFAYAPHSDNASSCITDMSRPDELGDPWLIYRLGGTEQADGVDGWKARQVDLLYDFQKDLKREYPITTTKVDLDFKHALCCVGDRVTFSAGDELLGMLKQVHNGTGDVVFRLRSATLDYLLTRKGRLVLNHASDPNWQAVESEDAKVHRYLDVPGLGSGVVLARATSSSNVGSTPFTSADGQGIFYIPIESGGERQQVSLTADFAICLDDVDGTVLREGTVTGTYDLSYVADPSTSRDLSISLSVKQDLSHWSPAAAKVGDIICSHGFVNLPTTGDLPCGGEKVAVVTYVGSAGGGEAPFNHGLALALRDAGQAQWCPQTAEACLGAQFTSVSTAINSVNGLEATESLVEEREGHAHSAASLAANYQYATGVAAGSHPVGTSPWFLPAMGQWNLMVKTVRGLSTNLSASNNTNYQYDKFAGFFSACGGENVQQGLYWASTESSVANAWYMSFEYGKTSSTDKTTSYYVRPVLAF